jgi:hypothetical protein
LRIWRRSNEEWGGLLHASDTPITRLRIIHALIHAHHLHFGLFQLAFLLLLFLFELLDLVRILFIQQLLLVGASLLLFTLLREFLALRVLTAISLLDRFRAVAIRFLLRLFTQTLCYFMR